MISTFDDKSYVYVLDVNKEFDFKEGQTVTFWTYGLGVWNPKDCLEKREVVLRLRQNIWKKYNDV